MQDNDRKNHPVWTVYDKLRTARLNSKYYGRRKKRFERLNLSMELVLAVTAPSSAIVGLAFWNTQYGRIIWSIMGIVAAVVSIMKPLLKLTNRIRQYESVLSGYILLEYDLNEIRTRIGLTCAFDDKLQKEFMMALKRERKLVEKSIETRPNRKVKLICEKEVKKELPPHSFYIPEE